MRTNLAFLAIIAALLLVLAFLADRLRKASDKNERYESVIKEKDAIIEYRTNEHGRIVAEKDAAILTTHEFMKFYADDVNNIKKDFDIKIKNLKGYIKAEFSAQGSGEGSITNNYYIDSTGRQVRERKFHFTDGYLEFKSTIFDSLKTAFSEYTYTDTLSYVFHTKKKWLFGDEQLYGAGQLANKNAKITAATNVLIKDYKDKRWVISAVVSYVPFGPYKVQPTVSFGYAIFKF